LDADFLFVQFTAQQELGILFCCSLNLTVILEAHWFILPPVVLRMRVMNAQNVNIKMVYYVSFEW